jgi:hypothetical protein
MTRSSMISASSLALTSSWSDSSTSAAASPPRSCSSRRTTSVGRTASLKKIAYDAIRRNHTIMCTARVPYLLNIRKNGENPVDACFEDLYAKRQSSNTSSHCSSGCSAMVLDNMSSSV